jgi:hypothetical protein
MKMLNTGAFKRFTISVLKVACGIVLATLILGLVVWGGVTFRERSEEAANAPLATLKKWPEVTVSALADMKFQLQTVWRKGSIYYQFNVQGYPPELRHTLEHETQAAFNVNFVDKDGFRIFEHRLALAEMSSTIGGDGQPVGMLWKGDQVMDVDLYRRAAAWELSWSGFSSASASDSPVTPPAASIPPRRPVSPARLKWQDITLWRRLSHGLSEDDVKRILGEPGKVSDYGSFVTWYYGSYPSGGEVTFDKDGTVRSWSEP